MKDDKEKVFNYIPFGKDNAITREQLSELTGYSDRRNRIIIATLRREGRLICSDSKNKGFWRADSVTEAERYIYEMIHSAMSILGTISKARRELKLLKEKQQARQEDLFYD